MYINVFLWTLFLFTGTNMFRNLARVAVSRPAPVMVNMRTNVTVSAGLVKKLRDLTGAPMIECKKALTNVLGDEAIDTTTESLTMTAASEWLRKRGSALAANKAGRTAKEGVVVYAVDKDARKGAVVEINCETDFVARNSIFLGFATRAALAALNAPVAGATVEPSGNAHLINMETYTATTLPEGPAAMATNPDAANNTVAQELIDVITNCRENVKVRRAAIVEVPAGSTGFIAPYIHNELPTPEEIQSYIDSLTGKGYQIRFGGAAALATVVHQGERSEETLQLTRKIAMQAVAARPDYLARVNVPQSVIEKEKEIILATSNVEGKDPKLVERLIDGKLNKFYENTVLLDQQFLITNDTKKPKIMELLEKDTTKPSIVQLLRFQRGEGVEEGTDE